MNEEKVLIVLAGILGNPETDLKNIDGNVSLAESYIRYTEDRNSIGNGPSPLQSKEMLSIDEAAKESKINNTPDLLKEKLRRRKEELKNRFS